MDGCTCVCMYVCVCICMYVIYMLYIYVRIYVSLSFSPSFLYTYTYVCVYIYIYIYIYMCVCVCVCVCMYRVNPKNVVVGNVACYGATSGWAFFRGKAGRKHQKNNKRPPTLPMRITPGDPASLTPTPTAVTA